MKISIDKINKKIVQGPCKIEIQYNDLVKLNM